MARRWTPKRFANLRRIRVIITTVVLTVASVVSFTFLAYKTVVLVVNGEKSIIKTVAMTTDGVLQQAGVTTKTHDFVQSTSGTDYVTNNDVITVRSAYQTTVTIDGTDVKFWTYAKSASQLLEFFNQNEKNAVKVTVNITNIYNKLTGGFVINAKGSVTVIYDGKQAVIKNGQQPAAAILDSLGIQLGKEDRVSVEQTTNTTILRVQRVTHSTTTQEVTIPYTSRTVYDSTMDEGTTAVVQQGEDGSKTQTYYNTLVDGVVESSTLTGETVTKQPIEQITAIGTKKVETEEDTNSSGTNTNSDSTNSDDSSDSSNSSPSRNSSNSGSSSSSSNPSSTPSSNSSTGSSNSSNSSSNSSGSSSSSSGSSSSSNSGSSSNSSSSSSSSASSSSSSISSSSSSSSSSSTWHATAAQAQAYAKALVYQYGWSDSDWSALVWLWNRESGWRWNAENKSSGAYGIPQSLPGSKMATVGSDWKDNAATQIVWGLNYIKGRYGTPSVAKQHSVSYGWY